MALLRTVNRIRSGPERRHVFFYDSTSCSRPATCVHWSNVNHLSVALCCQAPKKEKEKKVFFLFFNYLLTKDSNVKIFRKSSRSIEAHCFSRSGHGRLNGIPDALRRRRSWWPDAKVLLPMLGHLFVAYLLELREVNEGSGDVSIDCRHRLMMSELSSAMRHRADEEIDPPYHTYRNHWAHGSIHRYRATRADEDQVDRIRWEPGMSNWTNDLLCLCYRHPSFLFLSLSLASVGRVLFTVCRAFDWLALEEFWLKKKEFSPVALHFFRHFLHEARCKSSAEFDVSCRLLQRKRAREKREEKRAEPKIYSYIRFHINR